MKTKKIILLIFLFSAIYTNAQTPAPGIKVTDIFGNFYNSQVILDEGKHIFIDFFSNECGSCQYLAPYVDSAYQELGCNCGDVFYFAINGTATSTDESVFEFMHTSGLEMPAISGKGNGSHIADIYEIPYVPYFTLISPDGYIIWDTSQWITNTQEWLDTMANFGILPSVCSGSDILFYEAKTDTDTFIATVNTDNNEVILQIPESANVSELEIFMISSSKSKVYLDGSLQNTDSSVVDLSNSLLTYTIYAEDEAIFEDWNIVLQTTSSLFDRNSDISIIFNTELKTLSFSDLSLVEQYFVFDIYGRQLFKISPTVNTQDFNHFSSGIYIVSVKLTNGKTISQKIIIK